ncbi:hypothetical protein M409DRAFT_25866 [Zasmidium cellare ATCC 36951]|uniref:Major facilitator superfamily (MFS) profile domain-containing protein n=1 Tax=Zasmidium cellare ATCC 36951 TaxID=1080233 RepID=A0A6A6CBT8_ZASCE|nr:uncharacterized protein M409DRAFT_25866 [Zasmidium cellare ATCC 36951]KAF2163678.1 hypothetical protein M409DRAFT_25866 [Zasmidium cellare ATCC 36951]
MAPRNIYSWVEDLRGPLKSPYSDDDDISTSMGEEEAEREWQSAKARATLEGKYLSFADAHADVNDPWKIGDDEESDDDKKRSMEAREDCRPEVAPEPLRPNRSDTTKVHKLHEIAEPVGNEETQNWSKAPSATIKPSESIEDLQKTSNARTNSADHSRSPTEKPLSQAWTLTPSDVPYRPSRLINRDSQKTTVSNERGSESAPIASMLGSPYRSVKDVSDVESVHTGFEATAAELVTRPSSVYQPNRNRDTIQPGDSISCAPSREPTLIPSRRSTAGVSVGDRISYPPQLPPTLHTSPRTSRDPLPRYSISDPSRDVEMQPIYSVPLDKLPEPYKPEEPLNGRTAWLQALAGFLVVFNCWGITNAYGLFQAYYEQYYLSGTSASSIAWIGSTQLCLVFSLGVPIGRLVDKGYFKEVFHSGTFVIFLGLLSTAFCKTLPTLWLTQGLLTGIGMGMVFCSGLVAMMTWFDEKHLSMAMGLCAAGSCVGGIVYVLVARSLLMSQGFRTTMLVLMAIEAVTMLPANRIFRMRGQKHRDSRLGHRISRVAPPSPTRRRGWRTFTEASYLLVAGGMFFSFMGVYFGFVYIISYGGKVLHMSHTGATNLLIFMLLANLPGRFLPALISDKCIGPLNTIIPSLFLSSGVVWLWAASTPNTAALTVIACFYGFVSAGVQVLYAPTMYSFCVERHGDGEEVGTDKIGIRAGGISTCIGLACLIGTPIGGALISRRMDRGLGQPFLGAQIFAGVCLLLGGFLLLGSRVAKAGWAPKRV